MDKFKNKLPWEIPLFDMCVFGVNDTIMDAEENSMFLHMCSQLPEKMIEKKQEDKISSFLS